VVTTDSAGGVRDQARAGRGQTRPILEVLGLSVVLALLAGGFIFLIPDLGSSQLPSGPFAVAILAVAFGGTLLTVFRIEFRQNAILFSLSEIPLTFALLYLAPLTGIATRVGASLIVFSLIKRPPVYKQFFNLSMFAFETSAAYLMVRLFLESRSSSDVEFILASTSAVTIAGVSGSVAVALAVSRFSGDTLRHIVDELKAAWVLLVNAAMAGALLSLFLLSPTFAGLALVPVVALWFMMRRHGELAQRLRDLRAVHGFAGRVGRSLDLDEIGEAAISEASRLLRSDVTILAVLEADGSARLFCTGDIASSMLENHDWTPWGELAADSSTLLTTGSVIAERVDPALSHVGEVIVAAVDDEIGAIGRLLLARRPSSDHPFGRDDVAQAQNLADQLASNLRKGMLHRQIGYEARHDALTGLANRLAFERELIDRSNRIPDGLSAYVMMFDLDRFKEVNDTLGHHAGDDLLIEFADRLTGRVQPDDFVARLAGDEFALITYSDCDEDVFEFARQCVEDAARPFTLDGLALVITASVGIAAVPAGLTDPQTPLRHADIAMYNAKSRHLGVDFFRPELDRRTPARLSMLGDLREAIEEGKLGVEYQPKLDLSSGLITGAEALVRWTHEVRGVVPPTDFVRVAEETGLIKQLTDTMLSKGIAEMRRLHDRGHRLSLSVNLSTHDLLDAKLASRVDGYLSSNGVDPRTLTLEITESSLLMDAPRSRSTIHELNEQGIRLSIDDFGTGYSSLSYLRQLPVRELKVDQSFIANMLLDQQDEVIVRSTIDLGHNLGLEVVAEGVESNQTLERLRDIGCDVAQGFCVSRPLTARRLSAWLHTSEFETRRVDPLSPEAWDLALPPEPWIASDVEPDF
jgi:diguanylate cyclase (GGDEF)-like protein